MDEKNMDPPPYESSQSRTSKIFENRLKIIVGLDYGTTNSGISYVTSDQSSAEKIEIIRTWPGNGPVAGKVPSQIAYKNENVDELEEDQWGFMDPGLKTYLWTKLLLGKDSRSRESQHSSLRDLYGNGFCTLPPGKTAKDVATDYLRGLYKYLEERLRRHDDAVFRITPMEFWITVPAMWTDSAKMATIEAAQAAGFGSRAMDEIHIITEPEAAALTVLMPRVGLGAVSGLENGSQNILICDCGGGTVDIVTYKAGLVDGHLDFEELLVGTGAMCGSTFIDRNFNDWMTRKFGKAYTDLDFDMRGPASNFFRRFEVVKRGFEGPNHRRRIDVGPINMDTPRSELYDKKKFMVRLQASDMLELFDPPINDIVKLVESQVNSAKNKGEKIHQVFLVGGFGESPYLNTKLKEWCSARNIELKCPAACQEAIVKGAALRGLEGLRPAKRLARRHYGYSVSYPFREGVDDEDDAWHCDWDNSKWATNRVKWFLSKGDPIDNVETKLFPMYKVFWEGATDLSTILQVWNCDQDHQPETTKHWSMQKMGRVHVNFTQDEYRGGISKFVKGRKIYRLNYDMEVDLYSDRGDIQIRGVLNGKRKEPAIISFERSYDMMDQ